jgi:hypothetical protein
VASTAPGQQAALASQSEAHALVLSPNGTLALLDRASGGVRTLAGPTARCSPPFELVLLPSGLLVLRDARGLILWSSTSACAGGNSSCYSHALQDDGRLVVTNAGGAAAFDSGNSASGSGSGSAAQGTLRQLVSGSTQQCIFNWGPLLPATQLVSPGGRYALRISQQAQLQLLDAGTGARVWAPAGAVLGEAPARVCLGAQGALVLSDTGRQLWLSRPRTPTALPLVAQVTDAGRLEVLDGACATVWDSGSMQPPSSFQALQPPGEVRKAAQGPPNAPPPAAGAGLVAVPSRKPPAISTPAEAPSAILARPPPRPSIATPRRPPPRPSSTSLARPPPRPSSATLSRRPPPRLRNPKLPPAISAPAKAPSQPLARPPPRLRNSQPPLKARPPPALRKAVKQGPGAAALVALPDSSGARATPAHVPQCRLVDRAPCGGHLMCGADQACRQQGCCEGQLVCSRASEWIWFCSK